MGYDKFEGLNQITDAYQKAVAKTILENELGGPQKATTGYELTHSTGKSGWSFGGYQLDNKKSDEVMKEENTLKSNDIKTYKDLEGKKPLFEMVDMGYIALEFGFTLVVLFGWSGAFYKFGDIPTMIHEMKPMMKLVIIGLTFRQSRILYKAFVLKLYNLKFYEDGIYRVENNQFIPLDSVKGGNNVFWCAASHNSGYWTSLKFFLIILFIVPIFILHSFFMISRLITSIIYQKNIFANQYSLIVIFHDEANKNKEKIINIPYGYLKKDEKEFIKNYFFPYFNIDKLEKSFLNLPSKEEE